MTQIIKQSEMNTEKTEALQNRETALINLDAYFERIGYTGERTPTLETLGDICLRHTEAIPFENLNPLLRLPVRLDAPSLEQKIVRERRGGYCFEQNLLLRHALTALGFKVTGLAARVLWNLPEGTITPRGHMLLRVDINGKSYIVDAGFGGLTLTGVLKLEPDIEQATPHEPFRLKKVGTDYVMQAQIQDEWKSLYYFDLHEQLQPDYEVTSWYLSNHPDSHFINSLIAARPAPGLRYALRNNVFTMHYLNGNTERRILNNAEELREMLENVFCLNLSNATELSQTLKRLIT